MRAVVAAGRLEIALAGAPLSESEHGMLVSATIRQRLSMPAQLELVFQGADQEFAGKAAALVGLSATVTGDPDRTLVFEGDVTAVEHRYGPDGGLEVRIRGYDPLHRLRKRQSVRGFLDLDLAELASRLLAPLGLSVRVSDGGERRHQVVQWRQSDLGFLVEAAAAVGCHLVATPGAVEVFSLAGGSGDLVELALGETLLEIGFETNGDDAFEEVKAVGWDPTTGTRFEASATRARSGRTAGARVPVEDLGGDPGRTLANVVARDDGDLRAAAQARLDRGYAGQVVARGVAAGHARIRPGATIRVAGVLDACAGDYLVTEATHTLDGEHGHLSSFSTAPPAVPATGVAPVVAPGVVDRVDDPEGLGRVTVSLPTVPGVSSEWLRVMLPGIGPGAGFVTLPSPGDEVVVLFPDGDLSAGIVLGGLCGGDGWPDFGVEGGEVRRYAWRTREGHEIQLDRSADQIKVATPNGSAVTLGRERLSISAATDLEIAAPGRAIVIRARTVDFVRAES